MADARLFLLQHLGAGHVGHAPFFIRAASDKLTLDLRHAQTFLQVDAIARSMAEPGVWRLWPLETAQAAAQLTVDASAVNWSDDVVKATSCVALDDQDEAYRYKAEIVDVVFDMTRRGKLLWQVLDERELQAGLGDYLVTVRDRGEVHLEIQCKELPVVFADSGTFPAVRSLFNLVLSGLESPAKIKEALVAILKESRRLEECSDGDSSGLADKKTG